MIKQTTQNMTLCSESYKRVNAKIHDQTRKIHNTYPKKTNIKSTESLIPI